MGNEKVTSFRIREETKNILDYLSHITKKKKSALLDESISLLVQKYKEMGYKIPDQILNISDIKLKEIEKVSTEIKNNYNIVDKILTIEIEKVLIEHMIRECSSFTNCGKIDYKNIVEALSKLDKNERIVQTEKVSKILEKFEKIISKRYDIIEHVIPFVNECDDECKSIINLLKKKEDIKRLLNALHLGLDDFEKELEEIKSIYNKLKKLESNDIVVDSVKKDENEDENF